MKSDCSLNLKNLPGTTRISLSANPSLTRILIFGPNAFARPCPSKYCDDRDPMAWARPTISPLALWYAAFGHSAYSVKATKRLSAHALAGSVSVSSSHLVDCIEPKLRAVGQEHALCAQSIVCKYAFPSRLSRQRARPRLCAGHT